MNGNTNPPALWHPRLLGAVRNVTEGIFTAQNLGAKAEVLLSVLYTRIAQVAPLAESVPPKLYGGTERVVAWLIEELVELGHQVTLFASGDSQTRANLVQVWPRALRLRADPVSAQAALLEAVTKRASDFDVVHFHIDWVHLPLFSRLNAPFLTTLHGRLDGKAGHERAENLTPTC